jgi:hypothetical protein
MNFYRKTNHFKKHYRQIILSLSLILLSFSIFVQLQLENSIPPKIETIDHKIKPSSGTDTLFQGTQLPLNITDYGNLYKHDQEVLVNNQHEVNVTYYLDDAHDWHISKVASNISNIQDERDWVNNSDFIPITVFRVDKITESAHNYIQNRDRSSTLKTISQSGAIAMRAHFTNLSFENGWDFFLLEDQNDVIQFAFTGLNYTDLYSPWIRGEELNCYYESDNTFQYYGYKIDYYEFVNASSNYEINSYSWGFESSSTTETNYGSGYAASETAMFVSLAGDINYDPVKESTTYFDNDFAEIYQNMTIPRGKIVDAYISFDYYAQYAMDSNENFIYFQINDKKIFSKGLGDINELGKKVWHSTGLINMDLWSNTSDIFESILENNDFNISVGIMSGATVTYTGFEDQYQQVFWFDNVSLILTSLANASQSDIDLKFNDIPLIQGHQWGSSYLNLTGNWNNNPFTLTLTTSSPSLSFELNITLFGFHETTSKIGQSTTEGVSYQILENGTIYWVFTHNFYMPAQYADFEFTIDKPENWNFISVLDPTLQSRSYEYGSNGNLILKISKENALYPGWWTFKASSPNYLNKSNTYLLKQGELTEGPFKTGESTIIKTQVNYSNDIPSNLDFTLVNLTVYDPEGVEWYSEVKMPLANGTAFFSELHFDALNTTGGQYSYTLFWSNGTALGGVNSGFIVSHRSYMSLLKPDDAKMDNQTSGILGDILPLRVYLKDEENEASISNAILSYNWTTGTKHLVEAALGIYETTLDTSDLGALGLYQIVIESYILGFENSSFNLRINLGENTGLQRLDSESSIIIKHNSTIRFYYYSDFDEEGISGAVITVNISNPLHYHVTELAVGYYSVEFSTEFISTIGTYQLLFQFSAPGYEEQLHLYQFKIVNPPAPQEFPEELLLLIIIVSSAIIAILGALSLRSYVILPRKRKKEAALISSTQRFKDMQNVQALVITHKQSGIPLFSKSYSILEKHKKELFSGFISAITTIGEEMAGRELIREKVATIEKKSEVEQILELDFKYFYCLICDRQDIRIVLILKEKASERIKRVISNLAMSITLQLSSELENWDGSLDIFEIEIQKIVNEYLEMQYKEPFVLNQVDFIANTRKDLELSKMQIRVLNVSYSIVKSKNVFYLEHLLDMVHETNKDLVINAIETLIERKIILPISENH